MYSFLRMRGVSIQNARIMSTYTNTQHSMRICSFCKFHHSKLPRPMSYTLLRHYATTDTLELSSPLKKKIKHCSKKYTELLEVTDQATTNTRATVRKLKPTYVSALMDQPDVTLDKLHKITEATSIQTKKKTATQHRKEKSVSKNKESSIHNDIFKESSRELQDTTVIIDELRQSGINDHTKLIKDFSFLNTLQQISKTNEESVEENDAHIQISEYNKISDMYAVIPFTKEKDKFENSLSNYHLTSQLLAYMDAYIQIGTPQKAHKMLMLSSKRLRYSKTTLAPLYNLLMESYISNAQLDKLSRIYRTMKVYSVQPNTKTYLLLLYMVARRKSRRKAKEIMEKLTTDMNSQGISFDDIMNTIMDTTQRNISLQCIRYVNRDYQVRYRDIDTAYDCRLLKNLEKDCKSQSPAKELLTTDDLENMTRTQIDMEKQCKFKVKSIALIKGNPKVKQQAITQIAKLEKIWKSSVTTTFQKNLAFLEENENEVRVESKSLYPFLRVLPEEEYINAIVDEINELATASNAYSTQTSTLYYNLGSSIYKKYEFQRKMKAGVVDSAINVYKKYLTWYIKMDPADKGINERVVWQRLVQEATRSGVYCDIVVPEWPRHVLVNIGKFLYNIILNNVKIPCKLDEPDRQIPAFYLLFRTKNNSFLREEIKTHPYIHKLYNDSNPETLTFDTVLLPTCSPPRPWADITAGGFLFSKTNFIRDVYTRITPLHIMRNTSTKQLYPAFDSLNQLGSIPWRINEPILDLLIQIFQEGGSEKLNVPQSPSTLPSLSDLLANETEKNRSKVSRLMFQLRRKKNEMYSLWCDSLYKLSLANHFRDKIFWMPHNLDFRGRAYPVPPHLTHLSSDLSRSILIFAQKKPLGPNGLDWLKIHTINLTGIKKREPTCERLKYANEVLDLIIDSARNPLTGKMWWIKSDEPWQTLAACKEIDNALRLPDPKEYMTGFPIHQDGSCNGLQHYAALGRDQIGAESVNLYPSHAPQDVYSVVVAMVEEFRKADAEAGNEIAKMLEGHITRKVIKQTVMTTVYGVTKFGARLQISRQLSDLKDFNEDYVWSGSQYLVEQTFKSLRKMFMSAKEIQDWFTECSRIISSRCNQYVQWVTPLGLPVMQPYYKRDKSANPQSNKSVKKPDTLKQRNAFPPNFIHSLDSCHMMLTSLHCEQAGITFMSVHDCFWTHPCTVDIMNKICRKQFVALHSEPILEDLSRFLEKRYEKHFLMQRVCKLDENDMCMKILRNLPKKGEFDINNVLSSEYFFS